jgi:hypothetical protein
MHEGVVDVTRRLITCCLVLLAAWAVAQGGGRNEKIQKDIKVPVRKQLESYSALSPQALETLGRVSSSAALRAEMEEILKGNLSVGARQVDANGRAHIHRYLDKKFEALSERGLRKLGAITGQVAVPVSIRNARSLGEKGNARGRSRVTIDGVRLADGNSCHILPMWPNGAMPSICPVGGLSGPLVYVEDGSWEALRGLPLEGAIVLMDFRGGRRWATLASMGVQGVIAIEDEHISRDKAERWFVNTPVPLPRFYVDRKRGQELIAHATRKEYPEKGDQWRIVKGKAATMHGGNIYEQRRFESPFVYLPPTDPVIHTVMKSELLRRLGDKYGVAGEDIAVLNRLGDSPPKADTKLEIPGQDKTYKVKKQDLLKQIAASYEVSLDALLKANNLKKDKEDQGVSAGTKLTIPNINQSLVILVRIDSCSVVPDAPHGAKAAGNIAAAIKLMEHLATDPTVVRRKGVVFGFLDADGLGGRTSRAVTESMLLKENKLKLRPKEDPANRIKRYRQVVAWLKADQNGKMDEDTAEWLADEWLYSRLESLRIRLAEERTRLRRRLRELPEDSAEAKEIGNRLDEIKILVWGKDPREADGGLVDLRDETIKNTSLSYPERAKKFLRTVPQTIAEARDQGMPELALPTLQARLKAELAEEQESYDISQGNRDVIDKILDAMVPSKDQPSLAYQLDLADGTHSLGIVSENKEFRRGNPAAGNAKALAKRYRKVLAYAAVQAGWPEDFLILTDDDVLHHALMKVQPPPIYPEFWAGVDVSLLALSTQNDTKQKLDSPRDTLDRVKWANLHIQARSAMLLLRLGLESPLDSLPPAKINKKPKFGRLTGKIAEFNMRSGIDAQDPIAGAYVYYPALKNRHEAYGHNTLAYRGARRGILMITPLNGIYTLPLEDASYDTALLLYSYLLDSETGLFNKVADQGQIGSQRANPKFKLLDLEETEKKIVLTEVYPWMFFPGVDPREYNIVGETEKQFHIVDVVRNGDPKHYALDAPRGDYKEHDLDAVVVYMPNGSRARVAVQSAVTTKMVLSGWVHPQKFRHRGNGYVIGDLGSKESKATLMESKRTQARVEADVAGESFDEAAWEKEFEAWYQAQMVKPGWARNLALPHTPLHVAGDMLILAERRQRVYKEFGIKDQGVAHAIERAREKYARAKDALSRKDYQSTNGAAREAWGILMKAYGQVMELGREAVFSVVVLMGLLLPASMFLEKLTLGRKGIVGKLAGTTVYFVLGTTFLNFFHPGFKISVSPFIIMIAFTMILMSLIVLIISYQRFDVLLRRARAAGGEVESEEISLTSSLATALSMGVSNLKKRPARTFLTVFTVTVLTFSIVTFVSVRGDDQVELMPLSLDEDLSGRTVEPIPPKYRGVMFREFFWLKMDDNFVDAVETEFGARFDIAVRGHRIQVEGGNNADREGMNQEKLTWITGPPKNRPTWVATGIMVFQPIERKFSHLDQAVSNGSWFRSADPTTGREEDRDVIIIPDNGAEALGITEEDIYREDPNGQKVRRAHDELPKVRLMNREWRVIGILDTDLANRLRDVNGKSLAMVDYLRSAFASGAAGGGHLANEPESYHMPWEELVIVPYAAKNDVKAGTRSVAIRLRKPREITVEPGESLTDLAKRYLGSKLRAKEILQANESLDDAADIKAGMTVQIPGDDMETFRNDVALRVNKAMFGQVGGQISLITTQSQQSVAGLAKVVVPVILCVLIVLNTMMANVEERRGEVGMLGAIGLSPAQISFLLLSESTVFSVLGIVLGTFIGLLFANVASMIGILPGLSFNFTSLLSMALAAGTGIVVLIATLIPARKAAALAAPSGMAQWELPEPSVDGDISFELPFTLTRGNAVGMSGFFRRFLLNHTDPASPDFNCRDIELSVIDEPDEQALRVDAVMWLSPYDLDVAQKFALKVVPTESEGVFTVVILLHRTSGTEDAWLRTNYGFLDLVRRQFLLWRNLDNDSRSDYIAEGAQLFQEAAQ